MDHPSVGNNEIVPALMGSRLETRKGAAQRECGGGGGGGRVPSIFENPGSRIRKMGFVGKDLVASRVSNGSFALAICLGARWGLVCRGDLLRWSGRRGTRFCSLGHAQVSWACRARIEVQAGFDNDLRSWMAFFPKLVPCRGGRC